MNGQTKNYEFFEKQINDDIQTHNVYEPQKGCNIDLHALGDYIKTHNLSNLDITSDIVNNFKID